MNEQVIKFRVGVVLLTAGLVTAILLFYFTTVKDFFRQTYTVYATFPEAYGIAVNSPVRKSGVDIGRVTEVKLQPETNDVRITIKIYNNYPLQRREVPRIKLDSLITGDSVMEFVTASPNEQLSLFDANKDGRLDNAELDNAKQSLQAGAEVSGSTVSSDPMQVFVNLEMSMKETFESIQRASDGVQTAGTQVTELMTNLNKTLIDKQDDVNSILKKSQETLDVLQRTLNSIDSLVSDEELRGQLKATLAGVPQFIEDARKTLTKIDATADEFRKVAAAANTNLENVEHLTAPLRDKGARIVGDIEQSVQNIERLFSSLAAFADNLNNGNGSLSKFINDSEFYDRLNRIAMNVEDLSRRAKPIMEDLRIFSDKLAADPGILGVRGAINNRNAGIKYPNLGRR